MSSAPTRRSRRTRGERPEIVPPKSDEEQEVDEHGKNDPKTDAAVAVGTSRANKRKRVSTGAGGTQIQNDNATKTQNNARQGKRRQTRRTAEDKEKIKSDSESSRNASGCLYNSENENDSEDTTNNGEDDSETGGEEKASVKDSLTPRDSHRTKSQRKSPHEVTEPRRQRRTRRHAIEEKVQISSVEAPSVDTETKETETSMRKTRLVTKKKSLPARKTRASATQKKRSLEKKGEEEMSDDSESKHSQSQTDGEDSSSSEDEEPKSTQEARSSSQVISKEGSDKGAKNAVVEQEEGTKHQPDLSLGHLGRFASQEGQSRSNDFVIATDSRENETPISKAQRTMSPTKCTIDGFGDPKDTDTEGTEREKETAGHSDNKGNHSKEETLENGDSTLSHPHDNSLETNLTNDGSKQRMPPDDEIGKHSGGEHDDSSSKRKVSSPEDATRSRSIEVEKITKKPRYREDTKKKDLSDQQEPTDREVFREDKKEKSLTDAEDTLSVRRMNPSKLRLFTDTENSFACKVVERADDGTKDVSITEGSLSPTRKSIDLALRSHSKNDPQDQAEQSPLVPETRNSEYPRTMPLEQDGDQVVPSDSKNCQVRLSISNTEIDSAPASTAAEIEKTNGQYHEEAGTDSKASTTKEQSTTAVVDDATMISPHIIENEKEKVAQVQDHSTFSSHTTNDLQMKESTTESQLLPKRRGSPNVQTKSSPADLPLCENPEMPHGLDSTTINAPHEVGTLPSNAYSPSTKLDEEGTESKHRVILSIAPADGAGMPGRDSNDGLEKGVADYTSLDQKNYISATKNIGVSALMDSTQDPAKGQEDHLGDFAGLSTIVNTNSEIAVSDGKPDDIVKECTLLGEHNGSIEKGELKEDLGDPSTHISEVSRKVIWRTMPLCTQEKSKVAHKPSQFDATKLRRVKMLLFSVGSDVHRSREFENIFSRYWDAVRLRLSARQNKHITASCDEAIASFLVSKKLRRIHNHFIKGIIRKSIDVFVRRSEIEDHLPTKWRARVNVKSVKSTGAQRVVNQSPETRSLEMDFLRISDVPHPEKGLPYKWSWQAEGDNRQTLTVSPALSASMETISSSIPGALAVEPLLQQASEEKGLQHSDSATWLLTLALREYTKKILKASILHKKGMKRGEIHPQIVRYPNILASNSQSSKKDGKQRPVSTPPLLAEGRKIRIRAFDVYSAARRLPIGQIGSVGGAISRHSLEHSFHSSMQSLPPFVPGEFFKQLHEFLASEIRGTTDKSEQENSKPKLGQSESPLHNKDGEMFTQTAKDSEQGERVIAAKSNKEIVSSINPEKSTSQKNSTSHSLSSEERSSGPKFGHSTSDHSSPVQTSASNDFQAGQEYVENTVMVDDRQARQKQLAGVGRGAKNLAAMMARSSDTKEVKGSDALAGGGDAQGDEKDNVDMEISKDDSDVKEADSTTGRSNGKSDDRLRETGAEVECDGNNLSRKAEAVKLDVDGPNGEEVEGTGLGIGRGARGKGFGTKDLAAMLARSTK
ncbi:hypothetical protein IV203_030191 [Nitzschia inconspicua]|uniref:Uncharacterized protein n=1 Tax=Nitzschia inconspicua TaxID=303405 RepID=A0A9K3LS47_9STRA|nr:hypothetical protein IV203_030191 [Nitzschia inconspicua]